MQMGDAVYSVPDFPKFSCTQVAVFQVTNYTVTAGRAQDPTLISQPTSTTSSTFKSFHCETGWW